MRQMTFRNSKGAEMRAAGLLGIFAIFVSQPAVSDVVRRSAIPEPLWGKWAADNDDCDDKSALVILAKKYVNAGISCNVLAISENADARGTFYSTRAQCSRSVAAQKNLIIQQKDASHILAGPDFSNLKTFQKCDGR